MMPRGGVCCELMKFCIFDVITDNKASEAMSGVSVVN